MVINRFNDATVRRFRNGDAQSAKSAVFASPQVYFRVSRFHQSCRARNALYLLPAYSYLPTYALTNVSFHRLARRGCENQLAT